jgi:glycosyltransferase involved in cell wall biosynthesis
MQHESSRAPISAFIVCMNEERQIRRCLESVRWCAEIVVVDSGSTDRTLDICREYTDRIFHRDWTGYVEQKRFGLEQCSNEWVLNLDADEEVSPELAAEMRTLVETPGAADGFDGFQVNRVVFYLGRWWRKGGWYPEYRLRLCRRTRTRWGGTDPHEHALVEGPTRRLTGELRHFTYTGIRDHVQRLNSHTTAAAESLFRKGRKPSLLKVLFNPPLRFLKFVVVKKGYREGVAGIYVGVLEAVSVYLKYVKHWERCLEEERARTTEER